MNAELANILPVFCVVIGHSEVTVCWRTFDRSIRISLVICQHDVGLDKVELRKALKLQCVRELQIESYIFEDRLSQNDKSQIILSICKTKKLSYLKKICQDQSIIYVLHLYF